MFIQYLLLVSVIVVLGSDVSLEDYNRQIFKLRKNLFFKDIPHSDLYFAMAAKKLNFYGEKRVNNFVKNIKFRFLSKI